MESFTIILESCTFQWNSCTCTSEMSKIPWNCVRSFFKLVPVLDIMSQISLDCARFFFELVQDSFFNLCKILFLTYARFFFELMQDSFLNFCKILFWTCARFFFEIVKDSCLNLSKILFWTYQMSKNLSNCTNCFGTRARPHNSLSSFVLIDA